MKKAIFSIFLVLVILFPFDVNAATIKEAKITGSKEKKVGEEGEFTISIGFSGLEKGWDQTLGVLMLLFSIQVDEDVFVLTEATSPDFNTVLTYDNEEKVYQILSEVSDDASPDKLCAEGNLYCSDYSIKIKYVVKDTSKSSGAIEVKMAGAILLDMVENREYTVDDGIGVEAPKIAKHVISIKKPVSNSNKKPVTTSTPSKSENKALKSLTIDGYKLEFDRQKTDYTIFIDEGVNQLTVKATPEDKNATYKVIGADDLTASKNIVRVEVTAQDKTKQTYYIRVKYEKKEKEQMKEPISNETEVEKKAEPVNHDILKWIGIAFGGFVGIGLIAFIISKIKDHSIDKKLDALDDD